MGGRLGREEAIQSINNEQPQFVDDAFLDVPSGNARSEYSPSTQKSFTPISDRRDPVALTEKMQYQETLNMLCGEKCLKNPEKGWPFREFDPLELQQVVKESILIDKEFPFAESCSVFQAEAEGEIFAASFCLCDISLNRNSFFKMQLLSDDKSENYFLFRSWGRIGTLRGGTYTDTFSSIDQVIEEFEKDFLTVSGYSWKNRHLSKHVKGYMYQVDVNYVEFSTFMKDNKGCPIEPGSCTTLPEPIKNILLPIFNAKHIKTLLKEYMQDGRKLPLGNLSAMQLTRASHQLAEISNLVTSVEQPLNKENMKILTDMSNVFYSIFPHSFENVTPIAIQNQDTVNKLRNILDELFDIQFVSNILLETTKASVKNRIDPLDLQFSNLKTRMEVVESNTAEYARIEKYIRNGDAPQHNFNLKLLDLIKLNRFEETEKFKADIGNRKLLWHGSRLEHFAGILSQGLRIAPVEAQWAGKHAFGPGLYFADVISKSANYCRSTDDIGYLLLYDVALGNMKEMIYGKMEALSDPSFNSVKGKGVYAPDAKQDYHHPDGYTIPLGEIERGIGTYFGKCLRFNEYIVYDVEQIRARYLVRVKLHA